ncbi:protein madd-4-like [Tubulanus polymorphus]|uniref:protein madd-4-like n=1 Tax=Tubulanus polymorphus TaxID=672921 RepID=UPI003DA25B12
MKMSRIFRCFLLFEVVILVGCDNWTPWSEWSECTAECGGGVKKQIRSCLASSCNGDTVQYSVCNIQPCSSGTINQRDYLCGRLNAASHRGKFEWLSTGLAGGNPCSLYCRALGHNIIAKMALKVPDGYWCLGELSGMCINGTCRNIGCDGILGSDKLEDECGICGGQGETCEKPRYVWQETVLTPCTVSCGVGRQTTSFYCKDIRKDKRVKTMHCDQGKKPERKIIKCERRACEASWLLGTWRPCSANCGTGLTTRTRTCVYLLPDGNHTKVNETTCNKTPPIASRPCRRQACPKWKVAKWSPCSVPCGAGIRYRKVRCGSKYKDHCPISTKPLTSIPCHTNVKCPSDLSISPVSHDEEAKKPMRVDGMVGDQPAATHETGWKVGLLGPCSETCGPGIQIRTWECRLTDLRTNHYKVLPNHNCIIKPRPPDLQSCNLAKCSVETYEQEAANMIPGDIQYLWRYARFKPCSASCLGGLRTAVVECVRDVDRKRVRDHHCDLKRKPPVVSRPCNEIPCPPSWHMEPWGECGVTCGSGTQKRLAECIEEVSREPYTTVKHPPHKCSKPYPETFRRCNTKDCTAVWIAGRWSKCAPACGKGMKMRDVKCEQTLANGTTVTHRGPDELKCPNERPDAWKACKNTICSGKVTKPDVPPKIFSDGSDYVQTKNKASLKLVVGGKMTVIPGTSLVIRCPVKYYRRKKVYWLKNGKRLALKGRVRQTRKGVLKILRSRPRDTGKYTCVAGKTTANTTLTFHSRYRGKKLFSYRKAYIKQRANMLDRLSSTAAQSARKGKFLLSDAWDSSYNYSLTPYDYVTSEWQQCSRSCNGTGVQLRKVTCEVIMEEYFRQVEERMCEQAGIKKPPSTRPCGYGECPHWEAGPWQIQCPNTCVRYHMAMQHRPLMCRYKNGTHVKPDMCAEATRPSNERMCVNIGCTPVWLLSTWSQCSRTCGGRGIQSRSLHCVWRNSEKTAGTACKDMKRPAVVKPCYTTACEPSCTDRTTYCGLIKMLKLCRYTQYKNLCCKTCT